MEKPNKILQEWRKKHSTSSADWIEACRRMEKSPDMEFAWPELLADNTTPIQVLVMVMLSLTDSAMDARRLSNDKERKSIDKVKKATEDLLSALHGAQLLGDNAPFIEIGGDIAIASWTDYRTRILERCDFSDFPIVDLPGLLRILQDRCKEILDSPPINAIERQTNGPEWSQVRGFIRRLAVQFDHKYGKKMPENLARVACAVFSLEDPITGRDVEKILKNSPFRN